MEEITQRRMAAGCKVKLSLVVAVLTVVLSLRFAHSFQVTVLDTTSTESLDWETHFGGEGSGRGWREASYTNEDGEVVRVYAVCNVATTPVDSWLRTPFVATGDANRLYVEIRFSMRKCTRHPHPVRLQQCRESFKLLYFESGSDVAAEDTPAWNESAYRHVDVVAADRVFTELNRATVNTETRSVPVTRGAGLYFVFFDQGACISLLSIRVYYIVCASVTLNLAVFANTTTGPDMTSIVQREGTCVEHATVDDQRPSYLCKGDGNWYFLTGGCKCLPGYQPSNHPESIRCEECPMQTYKWQADNDACGKCPEHSGSVEIGATECVCENGFYRSATDSKSSPCTRPPSKVQNLTFVVHRDQTSVLLTWEPPRDLGGRHDLEYHVQCVGCGDRVVYNPRSGGLNATRVSLTGLNPGSSYHVIVYAENGVSRQSGVRQPSELIVNTDAAVPGKVSDLRITSVGTDYVALTWSCQTSHIGVETYEVKYWKNDDVDEFLSNYTLSNNITLYSMLQRTRYSFQVRGKTIKGWGEYSDIIYGTTGHVSHFPVDNPLGIVIGFSVAIVMCLLIVVLFVIIFIRRNSVIDRKKIVGNCEKLHGAGHCSLGPDRTLILDGGVTVPLFVPPGSVQTYVDPHTYEDPSQAVREFTKEINASSITIESVIGGGEFGDVCKGRMRLPDSGNLIVAIKTLKSGTSDKNRLDFLTEASIMGQFDHPNVIYLEGVVTQSHPIMIVTEFMKHGSLDCFLRNNDGKFSVVQLVGMIRCIASGMSYLAEMGYVHRDLAARNILVSENLVCKVSDFGLSRELESDASDGVYTTKGGKIPVRWTAPEAIVYRKFTSASDVFSYGVVTWEVMSYGERPYWNWSNQDVIKAIDSGYRLPPPMDCPETVYQLMLDCWQEVRSHRPKFSLIVNRIDKLIHCPDSLKKIAAPRPNDVLWLNCVDSGGCYDSVEDWLKDIKMLRYLENFEKCGLTTMDEVMHITHKDLVRLDVNLVGHQKKILNSVQALRASIRSTRSGDQLLV